MIQMELEPTSDVVRVKGVDNIVFRATTAKGARLLLLVAQVIVEDSESHRLWMSDIYGGALPHPCGLSQLAEHHADWLREKRTGQVSATEHEGSGKSC